MNDDTVRKWHLEDAEEAQKEEPERFRIPSLEERLALKPGSVVRLHFVRDDAGGPRAERMWVRLEGSSCGSLRGRLLDKPAAIPELSRGDRIEFEPKHIATILIERGDPRWIDETKYAFVSNRVMKDGQSIRFLYREAPDGMEDSGWRIFAGDESDGYVDDPKNLQLCRIESVLALDESLESVLREKECSAFERYRPTEPFKRVTDFRK